MSEETRDDLILKPGEPRRGSLTVYPYHVGIVICNGRVEGVFPEGATRLPKGDVRTYVASTAPFNLVFWLQDPGDPSEPGEGIALDQPVLTADGQLVTGRIDLTLSVVPDSAEHLLQLLGPQGLITRRHIADAIKGELLAKVLALDLHRHTASDLRGNRELFQGIYASLETELASTISRYGLKLDNFYVNWGLIPEERERIKEERHRSVIRDIERETELEQLGARRPGSPGGGPSSSWPGQQDDGCLLRCGILALLAVLAGVGVAVWLIWFNDSPDAEPAPASRTVASPTAAPTPTPEAARRAAATPTPPPAASAEDIRTAVAEAMAELPQPTAGPSLAEVAELIAAAMAEAPAQGASAEDIQSMVQDAIATAIAGLPQPTQQAAGPSAEEIDARIQAALANVQPGMTPEQVQAAVEASLANAATPTPTPASTPGPAVTPTAAPATPTATPAPTSTPAPGPATTPREAEVVWSYDTGSEVHSSPAVSDEWEVLYIGSNDGYLYALDSVTGAFLWKYATNDTGRSWPVVAGRIVYSGSNYRGTVYAIESGKSLWRYQPTSQSGASSYSPAVLGETVYVGRDIRSSIGLTAIDASTGEPRWHYTIYAGVQTQPAIVNGIVYFGSDDNRLYALGAKKGDLLWKYATNDSILSSPAVADGVVYAGSNDDHLYAVNAETGEFIWRYRTGGDVTSSPEVVNGIVYVGSNGGSLYALSAQTGDLIWSYKTDGAVESSPAVVDGVVYVGSNDGFLYALDAATGALVWSYETDDAIVSSPAVSGDKVYVGSLDGNVYAFKK